VFTLKGEMMENNFAKLAAINVSQHIEKKGNLSYLSWAWAVDQLMRLDPAANWEFHEPKYYGETVMVSVTVTAFGKAVNMQLPVMDNRNNAVVNPDARKISDSQMRCLVKAIACQGLGLYIYAGEDLPSDDRDPLVIFEEQHLQTLRDASLKGKQALADAYRAIPKSDIKDVFWKKHSEVLLKATEMVEVKA
jgi:hypothetical protein